MLRAHFAILIFPKSHALAHEVKCHHAAIAFPLWRPEGRDLTIPGREAGYAHAECNAISAQRLFLRAAAPCRECRDIPGNASQARAVIIDARQQLQA